ncbi:MAG: radical SAM protein [Bacteroidales bacterium]
MKNSVDARTISGWKARFIRFQISIHILDCALRASGNIVKALSLVRKISDTRKQFKGLKDNFKLLKADGRYFISENFPGWPSEAFTGFINNEISMLMNPGAGKKLTTVIFAITSRCRLGCRHCYEWHNIASAEKLSYEDLSGIVKKLKGNGVRHIQISGGEPLERFEDLLRLIEETGTGCETWLLTSGYGLTPEKAVQLKQAGLTGADISLDSFDESEHNKSRNNPESFFWAKEAARNCRNAGIVVSLSLCAFRDFVSYDNLRRYAELAIEWQAGIVRILDPREAGRFKDQEVSLDEDLIRILESFYTDMTGRRESIRYTIFTYPGYHQRRSGCAGAGQRYIYIDSAGEIHACPFCQRSAGNALSTDIGEALGILSGYGCQKFKMNHSV